MAADLRLVVHAAETHPPELQSKGFCDALSKRSLTNARRAHETENRAAALRVQFSHGEEFENASFHLLESVVVLVQDGAGALDIDLLGIGLRPGHGNQPIEIGARHRILGGAVRHALEAREFAKRLFFRFGRHACSFDGLLEFSEFSAGTVGFAEFFLDLTHPFAQYGLLLPFVERLSGLFVDLPRDLEHFDSPVEQRQNPVEPGFQIERRQDLLFILGLQIHEARHDVGQRRNRFNATNGVDEFRRSLRE